MLKTTAIITGLPVQSSQKMGFRSSVSKSRLPGEGRHEGLVPRNDVLTNGFRWVSLARSLTRILFVPCLRSRWCCEPEEGRAWSIQPKFQPVRPGKVVHLKRWTRCFETFPVGPNRSTEFWTEISWNFGWMDRTLFALFEAIRPWESLYNFFIVRV